MPHKEESPRLNWWEEQSWDPMEKLHSLKEALASAKPARESPASQEILQSTFQNFSRRVRKRRHCLGQFVLDLPIPRPRSKWMLLSPLFFRSKGMVPENLWKASRSAKFPSS